jgi:hypothetical protein
MWPSPGQNNSTCLKMQHYFAFSATARTFHGWLDHYHSRTAKEVKG